jgi:signal transduction histidine kinase
VARRIVTEPIHVLFGPWPLYPSIICLVAAYGLYVRSTSQARLVSNSPSEFLTNFLPNIAVGVFTSLAFALCLWGFPCLLRRLRLASGPVLTRTWYIVVLVTTATVVAWFFTVLVAFVIPGVPGEALSPKFSGALVSSPFFIIAIFIINGLYARLRARIASNEVVLAERLAVVRSERALLLAADERVRAEISRSLHDDIQSVLLRSTIRLEEVREHLTGDALALLDTSLAEIDRVRETGVRALGRELAPGLGTVGLLTSLRDIAPLYGDVMKVEFAFDEASQERFRLPDDGDEEALALYRITEQGLQNALKHGRSSFARVSLMGVGTAQIRLTITTNGEPPTENWQPGDGVAIINAWLDSVGGGWSLRAGPQGGAVLEVVVGGKTSSPETFS